MLVHFRHSTHLSPLAPEARGIFVSALFCGRFSRIGDRAGRRSPRFAVRARANSACAASAFSRAGAGGEKPRHGSDREIQRRVTVDVHVACHVASMYRAGSAARAPRCVEQARSATLRVRGVGSLCGGEVGGAWCARAACVAQHIPAFLILRLRRSTRRRRGAAGTRGARRGACRHAWGRRRPRRGHRGAAAAHGRHLPRGMLGAARGNRRGHRSAEAQHLRFEAVVSPGGRRPLLAAAAATARAERSLRL